ncbi:universal stress protein [Actinomadura rugatobispora]|uniref:Universal stress protein n=1 Tax=Actinomadura rugatobispora TaxID=1994 RepID=A0ABW1A3M5_9ACTN|nr:universal stress protein [Actinomadura rugatobispora]
MNTINGVVVGYDGSDAGVRALDWAAAEAGARGVPLTVVHVWELNVGSSMGMPVVDLRTVAQETLENGVGHLRETAPDLEVKPVLERGTPAARLIEAGSHADLIVVGSRGWGGFTGLMLGSVGAHLAAHAPCPVVVVRGEPEPEPAPEQGPARVVVGVDGSPGSRAALALAFTEADAHGAPLTVLVAWEDARPDDLPPLVDAEGLREAAETRLEQLLIPGRERHPAVDVRTQVVEGAPREVLMRASSGARLLVVGSRGLGGVRGLLLGSVGHALVHHALCPVAIFHAHERAAGT